MKKIAIALLAAVLALCLTACGGGDSQKDIDLDALAADILDSGAFSDLLSQPAGGVPAKIYGFEEGDVSQCVMYYGTGATAEEIFLAKAADSAAASRLAESCRKRVSDQKAAFENYVPAEIPKLDSAVLETSGDYVFLVVSGDSQAVRAVMDGYLG